MFLSKAMIVRLLSIALVIIAGWTLWKRIDAIIDNYQKYYDIALIQKIWSEESRKFNEGFTGDWNVKSAEPDSIDRKWEEYLRTSPFKTENKPVPQVADEYTKAYYHGLWNFFIRSGFASIFSAIIIGGLCIMFIRRFWTRITEKSIEKLLSKF
jgi:hypothetical protein